MEMKIVRDCRTGSGKYRAGMIINATLSDALALIRSECAFFVDPGNPDAVPCHAGKKKEHEEAEKSCHEPA